MEGFPGLDEVRDTHPSRLAVLLGDVGPDDVGGLDAEAVEAVVVASQRVQSWASAIQAAAVDRHAELTVHRQEAYAAELAAVRAARESGSTRRQRVILPEPDQVAAASLAPLLNISPRTMRTRLVRARQLMELPATFALAHDGVLEPWRVDAVVTASMAVSRERLGEFEARLYDRDVATLPKPRLAERAAAAAAKADLAGVEASRADAPRRRRLRVAPADLPGLMRWTVDLPDHTSRRLYAAVEALAVEYLAADVQTGTHRTVDAARVDALVDLAMANAVVTTEVVLVVPPAAAQVPTAVTRPTPEDVAVAAAARRPPHRDGTRGAGPAPPDPVLVDLLQGRLTRESIGAGALEIDLGTRMRAHLEVTGNPFLTHDRPRRAEQRDRPGRADASPSDGSTPTVDANGQSVWFVDGLVEAPGTAGLLPEHVVAILRDPDTSIRVSGGSPGSADGPPVRRRTYQPGKALAEKVRARDVHCRFPGCSVPAARCHLDHVDPYPNGETVEANLHALCPAHHGFKHHAGWTITMTSDGTCTWTAPTGRRHVTEPGSRRTLAA